MFASSIKEVDAKQFSEWVNEADHAMRVIDVRQMEEIAMGTVPKAEAHPLATLPAKVQDFSREEKMVIVCRSGARSAQACMFLQQNGFSNVYNLRGGMIAWAQSGFPAFQLA
ncbi:MAG: rhodanese-like domain-containing protein [Gallionellaceae bacterium]